MNSHNTSAKPSWTNTLQHGTNNQLRYHNGIKARPRFETLPWMTQHIVRFKQQNATGNTKLEWHVFWIMWSANRTIPQINNYCNIWRRIQGFNGLETCWQCCMFGQKYRRKQTPTDKASKHCLAEDKEQARNALTEFCVKCSSTLWPNCNMNWIHNAWSNRFKITNLLITLRPPTPTGSCTRYGLPQENAKFKQTRWPLVSQNLWFWTAPPHHEKK